MRAGLQVKKRLLVLMSMLILLFLLVGVRIGGLTFVEGEALTRRGVAQWTREGVVAAQRGAILDRNGEPLVLSATAYMVSVNPRLIGDVDAFARVMAPLLDMTEARIRQRVEGKRLASVILKRQVDRDVVDQIRALRGESLAMMELLSPVSFDEDNKRWYAKGAFLTQILGLTTVDAVGQSGIESRYEEVLAGAAGSLRQETDARGRLLPDGKTTYVAPTAGDTLVLTVDAAIQGVVEKAMRECLAVNDASSVRCIVMEPSTGAILAMCMKPDYDPNDPPRDDVETLGELMRITAVSDVYEPGSVFKILTTALALDCGAVTTNSAFQCTGSIRVDGDLIRCWKNCHGHQTLEEAVMNSCNPAFVSIALKTGTDTFYRYLRAFGLGVKTGIELPGESAGILISAKHVKNVDLARIGFGQSVAVTPLQMLTAACAAVNGGRLMKPYIVKEIRDEGGVVERTQPTVVARPITEETSATMRAILERVVKEGGGKNAAIEGYRIGGKTGTAQFYRDGKIEGNLHIGSFIGFAPADNPRVAVIVTVSEAKTPIDYGGTTAAPFARQILSEVLPYLGVKKEGEGTEKAVTVPDVRGMTVGEAKKTLSALHLLSEDDGQSDTVSAQMPAGGAALWEGGRVMLYTYEAEPDTPESMVLVPDVTGMSLVEASRMLRARYLEMYFSGSGLATRQIPAGGTYAAAGTTVQVTFGLPGVMGD